MSNTSGAYPVDPTSQVGLFRIELGDLVASNINGSTADYEALSDSAISALISANPTAPGLAMAKALSSWANQLIAAAQDIQVDDIKIKTVEKAKLLSDRADALSLAFGLSDAASAFSVVGLNMASKSYYRRAQGTPDLVGESGF